MGDPNAILAINSLDRYISNVITIQSYLDCTWDVSYPLQMTVISGTPVVNAVLSFSTGNGFPVPPAGKSVIILSINGNTITINYPVTANAAIPSITYQDEQIVSANQPISNSLNAQWEGSRPYSNNFTIQSPGALIYGYINKIIVSQIQLYYNIPTVCTNANDIFYIYTLVGDIVQITIPHGFYYPDELAAMLQAQINDITKLQALVISVVFNPREGFIFTSNSAPPKDFSFPSPALLRSVNPPLSETQINNVLKCYRLLGMTTENAETSLKTTQISFDYPIFLYTPYIDIYSDILTNYQNIKDTNTSIAKPKGLVARIYLSGTGGIEATESTIGIGTRPFLMTADLNNPKVIRWSPDVAVPSIDFQLLDQYGQEIPGGEQGFSTEFYMTLLCVEG